MIYPFGVLLLKKKLNCRLDNRIICGLLELIEKERAMALLYNLFQNVWMSEKMFQQVLFLLMVLSLQCLAHIQGVLLQQGT